MLRLWKSAIGSFSPIASSLSATGDIANDCRNASWAYGLYGWKRGNVSIFKNN